MSIVNHGMDSREAGGQTRAIVVAGYPKSGNTWITRLTAELVGCPVAGFWGHPEYREVAVEGAERVSPDRCFKAHHSYPELCATMCGPNPPLVVYVVRDPRDVAVSASHYFSFRRHIRRCVWLRLAGFGLRQCGQTREEAARHLLTRKRRMAIMVKGVLEGDADINEWCRLPWAEHVSGYLRAGIPFVRYEDMLAEPERECARLLAYLGIERDASDIREAVDRHAFQREKERFARLGETAKADFLRQGRVGEWRESLTPSLQAMFQQRLAGLLRQLNYAEGGEKA